MLGAAGGGGCEMLFLQECDRAKHVFSLARALSKIIFATIVAVTGRGRGGLANGFSICLIQPWS